MNNKNKMNVMQFILIAGIALFIAGNLMPINDFSFSDMYEKSGKEKPMFEVDDFEVKYHFGAYYWRVRDDAFSEITGGPNEMSRWKILHLFEVTSTEGQTDDVIYEYVETQSSTLLHQSTILYFLGLPIFVLLVSSVFFALIAIKNSEKKYSRASLYAGICFLIPLVLFVVIINYSFSVPGGVGNGKYLPYLNYNLGFYYSIISALLFFVAFFMQRYIAYPKKFFENKDFQQVDLPVEE